jgi:hypothetical protein
VPCQKGVDLGALRCPRDPTEDGALESGGCGAKTYRLDLAATLREAKREGAVEDIAGRQGIDALDRKGAHVAARRLRAGRPPVDPVGPVGHRQEGRDRGGDPRETGHEVLACGSRP